MHRKRVVLVDHLSLLYEFHFLGFGSSVFGLRILQEVVLKTYGSCGDLVLIH